MTVQIRGVDLIRSQAPKMNKHEVPSYYGSCANNTTKGLRSGSIIFGKNPTCQHTTKLSEFIARQVPCRPDLYLKQEPNVRTLWPDIKTMASLMKLTVPSAASKQLSRCVNPNRLKTVRLENNLRLCGENWQINSSLFPDGDDEGAFIVPALDARSHVLSIKDRNNGVGKPVFKLASLGSGQLFTLVSLDLSVLGVSAEVLQLVVSEANVQCVMAAVSPPRLFAAWRVEAPFSAAYLFDGFFTLCALLTRSAIVHDATHCSKEDTLYECERPCDALSCLFCFSIWLGGNQSILVEETQPAKDIDLTCFKTFPIETTTCLQVGSMSLEWPVDPFAGFDHSRSSLPPEVRSDDQRRDALPASTRSRWKQNTLQAPPQVRQRIAGRDTCLAISLPEVCGVLLGTPGVSLDLFFQTEEQRVQTQILQETL